MRIEKIVGYEFPVTISCDTEGCRTTFTVAMPGDMRRIGVWSSITDNVAHPQKLRERILAKCPCCGKDHEVSLSHIPDLLLERIPYDKSGDPVVTAHRSTKAGIFR